MTFMLQVTTDGPWLYPFPLGGGRSAGFIDSERVKDRGGKGDGSDVRDDGIGLVAATTPLSGFPVSLANRD